MEIEIQAIETQYAMTRLIWMQDNQPQTLLQQYAEGTLKQKVEDLVMEAFKTKEQAIKNGYPNDGAEELALNLLAPADSMSSQENNLISQEQFDQIVEKLRS